MDTPLDEAWEKTVLRDIAVGRHVGEYIIRRRIGEGGMGIVYEAEHPQIGRRVAIKVLRPDGMQRDLLSEARAASAIRHRHIIDVYGFGELDGLGQYLVMDFLEGVPLDQEIRQKAPMTHDLVIPILDDTLAALSAAHAKGVVHRDLKPGNLFLVQESSGTRYVKVLDFGLAKASASLTSDGKRQTREGMAVGTPEYMAPEQAQAKQVDGRTDLYSLGVIAFEMLTGRVPFSAASPLAVAMSQVADPPPPPRSIERSIPSALESLVLRLLAKSPDDRPSSAEVVRTELKRIKNDLASEATTIGNLEELRRPTLARDEPAPITRDTEPTPAQVPRRKPPALAIAFGGAAVAAIFAALLLVRDGTGATQPPPPPKPDPVVVAPPPVKPVPKPPVVATPLPAVEDDPEPAPVGTQPNRPRPAPKRAMGALRIVPKGCWMDVFVDGKPIGRAPHDPFPVATGPHLLRLTNPACTTPVLEKQIVIKPGETLVFEHNFRP